jgi:uncharacterized protein HemY
MDVESEARRLYEQMTVPRPNWDQLGDITKSVWRERAISTLQAAQPPQQAPKQEERDEQIGLF